MFMDESHGHHGGDTWVLFGCSCYCDHVMYLLRLCFGEIIGTMTSDYVDYVFVGYVIFVTCMIFVYHFSYYL